MTRIGVLALQGGFSEHITSLKGCGVEAVEVRTQAELDSVDGLIIPGVFSFTWINLTAFSLHRPFHICPPPPLIVNGKLPFFGTTGNTPTLPIAAENSTRPPFFSIGVNLGEGDISN